MKTVLISPFSRRLRNGQNNAKNYPYWREVVKSLRQMGIRVVQIGENGEETIGADELLFSLSFKKLSEAIANCDTWASVDNFFHHFCALNKKPGVVVFGVSDPAIFGHPSNINLLKDRAYLRPNQFDIWESAVHDPQVFVSPDIVVSAIISMLNK